MTKVILLRGSHDEGSGLWDYYSKKGHGMPCPYRLGGCRNQVLIHLSDGWFRSLNRPNDLFPFRR